MSAAWGCPHDVEGVCQRVRGARCSPGMRGCELEGRVRFALPELNQPRKPERAAPKDTPEAKEKSRTATTPRRRLPF
ncbi:MAG: hypothetical protein REI09_06695 [Candidatus Dactylopiibacterium sp.]|nr:hypothetical protein [Candidatus Dactylopiibacterium sp.]